MANRNLFNETGSRRTSYSTIYGFNKFCQTGPWKKILARNTKSRFAKIEKKFVDCVSNRVGETTLKKESRLKFASTKKFNRCRRCCCCCCCCCWRTKDRWTPTATKTTNLNLIRKFGRICFDSSRSRWFRQNAAASSALLSLLRLGADRSRLEVGSGWGFELRMFQISAEQQLFIDNLVCSTEPKKANSLQNLKILKFVCPSF